MLTIGQLFGEVETFCHVSVDSKLQQNNTSENVVSYQDAMRQSAPEMAVFNEEEYEEITGLHSADEADASAMEIDETI
jgi:hypothetical protein